MSKLRTQGTVSIIMMREIVIDTETTGLFIKDGHRIIEVACVEVFGTKTGRIWHSYFNPQRDVSEGATAVHGIETNDLKMSPLFKDKAADFLAFIDGANLIAHNAPFDRGFVEDELRRCSRGKELTFTDTLSMSRQKLPGKRHTLDALCKHYGISLERRRRHGATLDALLLAEVYIRLVGRLDQLDLLSELPVEEKIMPHPGVRPEPLAGRLTKAEEDAHAKFMDAIKGMHNEAP